MESEFANETQERTALNHLPDTAPNKIDPPIATAIRTLVPSGRRVEIRALFGNRITWPCVDHWRKGRQAVPQWARDIIMARMKARADASLAIGNAVLAFDKRPRRGTAGTMALKRYRAQKAKGTQ